MTEKVDYCRELEAVMKFSQERIGSYTPSFVQSYGWFESSEAMFIAMEYVPHGDLQRYLSSPIAEDEARIITRQLAEGLHHMHMNGFTHRDLKPGNILVVSRGPDWLVQISDFGISRRLRPDQSTLGTMRRGTLGFIAPEMLGFITDRSHPYAVDVWSLGTVIFRMVTEKLFITDFGLLQKYVASELQFPLEGLASLGVTESLASFLRSLLAPLPKERPTITEIMNHDWLQHSSHSSEYDSSDNSAPEDASSKDDSSDDDSDDDSEEDSSEDDSSEGGIQSQDEVDSSTENGDVASAAWSTAIICVKTTDQTNKVFATIGSVHKRWKFQQRTKPIVQVSLDIISENNQNICFLQAVSSWMKPA
ncbi:calcium calmodulin-dependent protein kinase type 1b [Colletotrichum asianum]|uniref:Autophagy-related protein 1 n=1 Tax=Colletotrichum asianum TaxID=702518 RepID=A0A8H3WJW7_9PEZI|nr:calcium calmodulin-dependent protein kinase type 1b [Colletotrichum asianum]